MCHVVFFVYICKSVYYAYYTYKRRDKHWYVIDIELKEKLLYEKVCIIGKLVFFDAVEKNVASYLGFAVFVARGVGTDNDKISAEL